MNDFLALDLSGAGMRVQRARLQTVAENLANQHTTGPDGPYRRKEVLFESIPVAQFQNELSDAMRLADPNFSGAGDVTVESVAVSEVREDPSEPVRVFDPSHPHADAQGYVALPNISIMREMTDMIEASRSYEANLAAAKTTQDILTAALELTRR